MGNNKRVVFWGLLLMAFSVALPAQPQNAATMTKPLNNAAASTARYAAAPASTAAKDNLTDQERRMLIRVQSVLVALSSLRTFSGVVIVAKNDEPVYKYIDGYTNLDYNVPNNLTSLYNTCGITETFTAIAIMQLVERGMINLYTPINAYLPELPSEMGSMLTVHNLLTHTSGLLDYYQIPEYKEEFLKINTLSDLVRLIGSQERPCNTSIQQRSGSNYVLLGAIIERLSGMPYEDYVREKVIKKAGMESCGLYTYQDLVENRAVGYMPDAGGQLIANADFYGAYPFGADGVYCMADDLLLLGKAMSNGLLVSKESLELMRKDYTILDKDSAVIATENGVASLRDPSKLGYGIRTKTAANGTDVVYQGGYIYGLSTQYRRYNSGEYSIVVFCNYYHNTAEMVADRLERAMLNEDYLVPREPIAYYFSDLVHEKGVDYVVSNFDAIMVERKLNLQFVWSLNELGNIYMDNKKFKEAEVILKLNAEKFPKEPIVYDSLGEVYYRTKEYVLAEQYFQAKLRIDPNDKRAKTMLDEIRKKINADRRPLIKKNDNSSGN